MTGGEASAGSGLGSAAATGAMIVAAIRTATRLARVGADAARGRP
jgi:hypothetical protein